MAVDGVALKQAVNAWASAPVAEKAARFASAEAIRWIEWGARSYLFECPEWTVDLTATGANLEHSCSGREMGSPSAPDF